MCPECQRPAPVGIQCVDCVREEAQRRGPLLNRLGFVSAEGTPVLTYALIAANVVDPSGVRRDDVSASVRGACESGSRL